MKEKQDAIERYISRFLNTEWKQDVCIGFFGGLFVATLVIVIDIIEKMPPR